jgi:PAS domain S-box-containing protein
MTPQQFHPIAELFSEPALLVDEDGTILAANQAVGIFGLSAADLRGRSLPDLTAAPREAALYLGRCRRSSEPVAGMLDLASRGGRTIGCHCLGARSEPGRGGPGRVLLRLTPAEPPGLKEGKPFQRERNWLAVILASIGDAVIATDSRGRVSFLNYAAEKLTGFLSEEAQGRPLEDVFHIVNERTREKVENPVGRVLREGIVMGLGNHTLLLARDGTERAIADSAAPIREEGGEIEGVVLVFRDVTTERRAEEARRRLAAIVESSDDAIWSKTLDGTVTSWNQGAERLFGYTADEMIGQPITVVVPSLHAAELADYMQRTARGEVTDHFETVRRRKDGTLVDVSLNISPLYDAEGQVTGASTIARDISRRRQSEEQLRLALEAGRMGTWEWDVRNGTFTWSVGLAAIHGRLPEVFPRTFDAYRTLIHSEDRQRVFDSIAGALEHGEEHQVEYRVVWPDGSLHWVEARGQLFRSEEGRPARLMGVCVDVHERKRGEQLLQFLADASATLAEVVDHRNMLQRVARLAVPSFADWCVVDMLEEGGILERMAVAHVDPGKAPLALTLSEARCPDPPPAQGVWNVIRTERSELVPETEGELAPAGTPPEWLSTLRELGLRSRMIVPLRIRGRVLGSVTFVMGESGRRYGEDDLAVAEDLAHRVGVAVENARLYEAFKEADRRKDEFLALLGHELRNPLAPITNALYLMRLPAADASMKETAGQVMERQVQHMMRLVDDLLDVSRIARGRIEIRKERIEIAAVVARAIETAQPVIDAEGHHLELALSPDPLWVEGDLVRLSQVIANLLNNAAKFTKKGGKITITAAGEDGNAVVRVRDTGIGLSEEMRARVFDMFYQAERRTKEGQGGLGIGLSLVRGLVEAHGGRVEARSPGPGLGSEFLVRLPFATETSTEPKADPERATRGDDPTRPRRVLVVDDNPDSADTLAYLLRMDGHDVRIAYEGDAALEEAKANPPEVAFLDLGMPKMDGYELARRFRAHPRLKDVRLVAVTGWGQPEDRRKSGEAGFDRHMTKPVEPSLLRGVLER